MNDWLLPPERWVSLNISLYYTEEPCLLASAPPSLCYYSHIILAQTKVSQSFSYITKVWHPINTARFLWPIGHQINEVTLYYSYWNSSASWLILPQVRGFILKARTEFAACYSLHVNNCDSVFMITWELIINFSSSFRWDPQCAIHLAAILR